MTSTTPGAAARAQRRALFADLVASGQFCRDTRLGGLFHRGQASLREISDGDSLHVTVDGDRLSVHVDHFSPVAGARDDGCCRYSVRAVVQHVAAYLASQARQLAHGARGRHRCRLQCELVEGGDEELVAACVEACEDEDDLVDAEVVEVAETTRSADRFGDVAAVG